MGRAGRLPEGRSRPERGRIQPPAATRGDPSPRLPEVRARVSPAVRPGAAAAPPKPAPGRPRRAGARSRCPERSPASGPRAAEGHREGIPGSPARAQLGSPRGDGGARGDRMATAGAQAAVPFCCPGVPDSGQGSPKWPPATGLLRPPAPVFTPQRARPSLGEGSERRRLTFREHLLGAKRDHSQSAQTALLGLV